MAPSIESLAFAGQHTTILNDSGVANAVPGLSSPHAQAEKDLQPMKSNDKTTSDHNKPAYSSLRLQAACMEALYTESVTAKIWHIAAPALKNASPPTEFPQYSEPGGTSYVSSPAEFWTSGFFPGCIAALYERKRRWMLPYPKQRQPHEVSLQSACRWWSHALHEQAKRTDEHDLGFMIQPWAQTLWELDGDKKAFGSLITGARSLASRFDIRVGAIRSWDRCFTGRYKYDDPSQDYLVIIDSLMNVNMLFYVADQINDEQLFSIARTHALTLTRSHIRSDNSTCHVVNFDQVNGAVKERITNQGFSDNSCWSRGQAWAITGYAQTYGWTRDRCFLDASCRLADFFIGRLSSDHIPAWDFNAPVPGPKDTSAAMIAAYGMLILHSYLKGSTGKYLQAAMGMVEAVVRNCLSSPAVFRKTLDGALEAQNTGGETILLRATINNFEYAPRRWADHGLVYADYYFLMVGNKLLEMGLV